MNRLWMLVLLALLGCVIWRASGSSVKSLAHFVAFVSWLAFALAVVKDLETEGWKAAAALVISHGAADLVAQAIEGGLAQA